MLYRTLPPILVSSLALVAATQLNAQAPAGSVLSYEVLKLVDYEQTSSTAPTTPITDGYGIEVFVEVPGSPTDTINPTPTVTVGTGSSGPIALALDGPEWIAEDNNSSQGGLDAIYGNGDYTFNLNFASAGADSETLSLTADATGTFFAEIPTVTSLTNAVWGGGVITIDLSDPLAIVNFNGASITDFGLSGSDEIIVSIEKSGGGFDQELSSETGLGSFSIGSGGDFDLTAGSYDVELEYLNVVDDAVGFTDAEGVAAFSSITSLQIDVVPEPSSYSLLGGLLVAFMVMTRRRR